MELGAGGEEQLLFPTLLHGVREGAVGTATGFLSNSLSAPIAFGTGLGGVQRGACNEPTSAQTADRERTVWISPDLAMSWQSRGSLHRCVSRWIFQPPEANKTLSPCPD